MHLLLLYVLFLFNIPGSIKEVININITHQIYKNEFTVTRDALLKLNFIKDVSIYVHQ